MAKGYKAPTKRRRKLDEDPESIAEYYNRKDIEVSHTKEWYIQNMDKLEREVEAFTSIIPGHLLVLFNDMPFRSQVYIYLTVYKNFSSVSAVKHMGLYSEIEDKEKRIKNQKLMILNLVKPNNVKHVMEQLQILQVNKPTLLKNFEDIYIAAKLKNDVKTCLDALKNIVNITEIIYKNIVNPNTVKESSLKIMLMPNEQEFDEEDD